MTSNCETRRRANGDGLLKDLLGSKSLEGTASATDFQFKSHARDAWVARKYCLSPTMSKLVASLAFGEVAT